MKHPTISGARPNFVHRNDGGSYVVDLYALYGDEVWMSLDMIGRGIYITLLQRCTEDGDNPYFCEGGLQGISWIGKACGVDEAKFLEYMLQFGRDFKLVPATHGYYSLTSLAVERAYTDWLDRQEAGVAK